MCSITGHAGSISTTHANSALQALSRLASLALRADIDLPYRTILSEIRDLIDFVVHIERQEGRRFVAQVLRVEGVDEEANCYKTPSLYDS